MTGTDVAGTDVADAPAAPATPVEVTIVLTPTPFAPFLQQFYADHTQSADGALPPNEFKRKLEIAVHNAVKPVHPGGFTESPGDIAAMIQKARTDYGTWLSEQKG